MNNSEVQENNEQILNDIQTLQKLEQNLFNNLESKPNLSFDEQNIIIEKMNQLSKMRIHLYKTLNGFHKYFENELNTSIGTLKEQARAIAIIENELNREKRQIQDLEEKKNNKIRLVEINNYFGEKYAEHSQLIKIIIFTLLSIIILVSLKKYEILPNFLFNTLLVIVALIGSYFFWYRFSSILMRDNMNYHEYDWYFNTKTAPTETSVSFTDPWITTNVNMNLGTCIGNNCCSDGLVYDTILNKCTIQNEKKENTKENFVNSILTKTQPNKYNYDYNLQEIKPFL